MKYNLSECGKRIKELRKHRNISQEELGQALGMTQQGISNLESGRKGTTIDTLVLVADYFRTSLDYLVFGRLTVVIDEPVATEKIEKSIKLFKAVLDNI
jgi:transcriptional regulator with XRE-family HTH domain